MKKQLAFVLVRQGVRLKTEDNELCEIFNNSRLSEYFMNLSKDLEITDPKSPEDIHKSYLDSSRKIYHEKIFMLWRYTKNVVTGGEIGAGSADLARQNLASTFINAFANAGFKVDKYMTNSDDSDWVYKNKDYG